MAKTIGIDLGTTNSCVAVIAVSYTHLHMKKNGFALTPKGFLVSNQLILSIIGA